MSTSIAYTTAEGDKIRKLFAENQDVIHLLPEVQFIGSNLNDIEALAFLRDRIAFHNEHKS